MAMSDTATLIKVAADSQPNSVAATITRIVRQGKPVAVHAVGCAAVERAMTAAALAWCYLHAEGIDVSCSPSFAEVRVDNQERTSVMLKLLDCQGAT